MTSEDYIDADNRQTYMYHNRYGDEVFYLRQNAS
jgi:hypothetical protein